MPVLPGALSLVLVLFEVNPELDSRTVEDCGIVLAAVITVPVVVADSVVVGGAASF